MKQYAQCFAAAMLLLASQINAACVNMDNQEIIEYSCSGGSIDDLKQIPNNAEKIRISKMPVGHITESLFSRFADNLIVLTCSHCLVEDIDDNAFHRLKNLQQLSLDNNRLVEVRSTWFEGLVYLTYLDLNYNNIERIDADVFRNAPELIDLRLSGNRLLCLDLESMSKLKYLKRIFLNENPNFRCPNAVRKFLSERHIDFEIDPNSLIEDSIHAGEPEPPPVPPVEEDNAPYTTPYHPRAYWMSTEPHTVAPTTSTSTTTTSTTTTTTTTTTTATPETTSTMEAPTARPRRPYIPEMIQPSVPEQDFAYQGPYYAPKVTQEQRQQQLDNYRNSLTQQMHNATEEIKNNAIDAVAKELTTLSILGDQEGEPTTTPCPNAAPQISRGASLFGTSVLLIMCYAPKWMLV